MSLVLVRRSYVGRSLLLRAIIVKVLRRLCSHCHSRDLWVINNTLPIMGVNTINDHDDYDLRLHRDKQLPTARGPYLTAN
jgi:hypothetical protein